MEQGSTVLTDRFEILISSSRTTNFVGQVPDLPAGVSRRFGCGSAALWGSFSSCSADFIGALRWIRLSHTGRLETGQQDAILPHSGDFPQRFGDAS
jgi:hypothetical protein